MNVAISNSPTTSRRWAAALLSACAVAVLAATASVAEAAHVSAADVKDPTKVVVKYRDLDLGTERGALILYHRIEVAAHRVCPDSTTGQLADKQAVWACRQLAVSHAVDSISSPQLATLLKNPRFAYVH